MKFEHVILTNQRFAIAYLGQSSVPHIIITPWHKHTISTQTSQERFQIFANALKNHKETLYLDNLMHRLSYFNQYKLASKVDTTVISSGLRNNFACRLLPGGNVAVKTLIDSTRIKDFDQITSWDVLSNMERILITDYTVDTHFLTIQVHNALGLIMPSIYVQLGLNHKTIMTAKISNIELDIINLDVSINEKFDILELFAEQANFLQKHYQLDIQNIKNLSLINSQFKLKGFINFDEFYNTYYSPLMKVALVSASNVINES